jgi:hypothetical protein
MDTRLCLDDTAAHVPLPLAFVCAPSWVRALILVYALICLCRMPVMMYRCEFVFIGLPEVWHKAGVGRRRSGDLST